MKTLMLAAVAALISVSVLPAQESEAAAPARSFSELLRETPIHKFSGYGTYTLGAAATVAALTDWEYQRWVNGAAIGSGLISSALGSLAYADLMGAAWPHYAFNILAEAGWILNAFVFEPGTPEYKAVSIASLVSLAAGFVAIRVIFPK